MSTEAYVIGGLGTMVTVLGGIAASVLNTRLSTIERKQEASESAAHALAIAVAHLTTEVGHLNQAINRLMGTAGG